MNRPAPAWGVEHSYIDARGRLQTVDPATVAALQTTLNAHHPARTYPSVVVAHSGRTSPAISDIRGWRAWRGSELIAMEEAAEVVLPQDFPNGSFRLEITDKDGAQQSMLLLAAHERAFVPPALEYNKRLWLLMVQLYAVRSQTNWGHGDFTDLKRLLQIAREAGAAGVGLNPIHSLAPGQASPYSPSSRRFLNPLYIDVEAIPEFPGANACGLVDEIAHLRAGEEVDYLAVHAAKIAALEVTWLKFCEHASLERRAAFKEFCVQGGDALKQFSQFESLRSEFGTPWHKWPADAADREASPAEFHSFLQWCADSQLRACNEEAKAIGLPIGLYLDVAVGVDADGADAWAQHASFAPSLSIGAPPDIYNPAGQDWGIVSFHPQALIESDFSSFRQMLRAVMNHAGAIRLDHALGLNRLFLIPFGAGARRGAYVRFPFEAMLAVVALESQSHRCLVIGEDLGTIPEGVCEMLNEWGIWSYRVALFERAGGEFRHPDHFPAHAIVTFNTHDLATFSGWASKHDLGVKLALGYDPGEADNERDDALNAMSATLKQHEIADGMTFPAVVRYLARTRSQLLSIAIEDILELKDQPNIPGTINEHPNWRRRLPIDLEDISAHPGLHRVAQVLAQEGRSVASAA